MKEECILIQWTDNAIKITVECDCDKDKVFYRIYLSKFDEFGKKVIE